MAGELISMKEYKKQRVVVPFGPEIDKMELLPTEIIGPSDKLESLYGMKLITVAELLEMDFTEETRQVNKVIRKEQILLSKLDRPLAIKKDKMSGVYLVRLHRELDNLKIGFSSNVHKRISSMRTTCPDALLLAVWVGADTSHERKAINWLKKEHHHIGGEVFGIKNPIEVISNLDKLLKIGHEKHGWICEMCGKNEARYFASGYCIEGSPCFSNWKMGCDDCTDAWLFYPILMEDFFISKEETRDWVRHLSHKNNMSWNNFNEMLRRAGILTYVGWPDKCS